MKKMLFMSALVGMVLTGCVKEEAVELENQPSKEIAFGAPLMYTQTKSYDGEIKGTTYPAGENFVVFAVETNGNFDGWTADNVVTQDNGLKTFFPTDGVVVTKGDEDNYWHITDAVIYHWPDDPNHKLTFAAYSPVRAKSDATITYDASGLNIKNFKMRDVATTQYDLLYSPRTTDATASPVSIGFKHALSSVRFKFVKPETGAYSIIVKKVEIFGNIQNIGTFSQNISVSSKTGSPKWDGLSKEGDVTYTLFSGNFEVPKSTGSEIPSISSFLPIPQNITSEMKVRIVYATKQQQTDVNYSSDITEELSFRDFIITGTQYTQSWDMGKRYVYHVHFGALKEIYFAPTITDDWVEVGEAGTVTL